MNKKAELFQAYLNENNVTCFEMQEIKDQMDTVVFRSTIAVEGQQLPTVVVFDNSFISSVQVVVATNALREDNEKNLLQLINEMNGQQKIMKHFLTADGAVVIEYNQTGKVDDIDCQLIMFIILEIIVKHLEAKYKDIMKKIWA